MLYKFQMDLRIAGLNDTAKKFNLSQANQVKKLYEDIGPDVYRAIDKVLSKHKFVRVDGGTFRVKIMNHVGDSRDCLVCEVSRGK